VHDPSELLQVEPLEAPAWVPPDVVIWARVLLADVKDDYPWADPIIRHFLTDSRMEAVWEELRKQGSDATLGRFFAGVVSLSWTAPPVVSKQHLEAVRAPLRERARSMRIMAATELRAYGINDEYAIWSANYLAEKLEQLATRYPLPDDHPWLSGVVVDRPGDASTRGYLIRLVQLSRAVFGKVNHRTMATIASVARNWRLRKLGSDTPQKRDVPKISASRRERLLAESISRRLQ
jgi:hypothetical protein